jgi:hypothetical protein
MYYDFVREPLQAGRIERPVGMLDTTQDLFPAAPREWGERLFNVQRWNVTDVGGHFLEWEEPELVARDVRKTCRDTEAVRSKPAFDWPTNSTTRFNARRRCSTLNEFFSTIIRSFRCIFTSTNTSLIPGSRGMRLMCLTGIPRGH